MGVNKEISKEAMEVIEGIKLIKSLKRKAKEELAKGINAETVEQIFNEVTTIERLSAEESFHFFRSIFKITNDDKFNPVSLFKSSNEEPPPVREDGKKITKDNNPRFYFNYNHKLKFSTKNYNEDTRRVVMALFRKSATLEEAYGKDLYDFNLDELTQFFKSLKAKTLRSLQNQISTVERYVHYSIKLTENGINYASAFDSRDKIESLLDKVAEENMIFDKDEIMEMVEFADNPQDGVIVGLLFDGVSHKNEFEELIELTKDNIDFDNRVINLEDRQVPMSDRTYLAVKGALDTSLKYISITGETSRSYKIAEGENVLRGLRGKNKVKPQIINQRLLRIKEIFDYEYLNATTIVYSGQIHLAKELFKSGLDIDTVVSKVLERFGIPSNISSQHYLKGRLEKYVGLNK
jgi:integrase